MPERSPPASWKPSPELRKWIRLALGTLTIGSVGGLLAALLRSPIPLLLFIIVYFYLHVGVLRRIKLEAGLDAGERDDLLFRLRWFGPAGMVDLALRSRTMKGTD